MKNLERLRGTVLSFVAQFLAPLPLQISHVFVQPSKALIISVLDNMAELAVCFQSNNLTALVANGRRFTEAAASPDYRIEILK